MADVAVPMERRLAGESLVYARLFSGSCTLRGTRPEANGVVAKQHRYQ